mmetsp:Transcript_12947/g.27419  ORF Transcript_12947/g.27419 Transcript_12947/m.27419 type:complete len:611 (+) Transcript_12947:173-2005(+)
MLPPSITSAAGVAARRTAASRRSRPPSAMSSNSKVRSVLLDLVAAPATIGTASNSTIRSLSSNGTPAAAAARKIDPGGGGDSTKPPNHRQDFVKVRLEPGQWDEDRTDPTFRPKWKSKASIISAEDFAARPKAGFGEEFASLHDSMTVLSWLTQADREAIYQMYCELMHQMSNSDRGATSHEYAMRVIAQKFNLTPARVAGIVQLEHEEDRIRKEHPDRKIHYKLQEFVDAKMKEHIADAYRTFGETPPDAFVEDPVGATGYGNPDLRVHATAKAEDLFDMDDLLRKSVIRERDEAQLAIDNHVYIEDVDNDKQDVKVNAECRALMQAKNAATEAAEMVAAGEDRTGTTSSAGGDEADTDIEDAIASNVGAMLRRPDDQAPLPEYGRGIGGVWADKVEPVEDGTPPRRPRWKYAAKIINTRAEKLSPEEKSRKKARARRKKKAAALGIAQDEDVQNTLVEHDARLRPATAEEASNVAWKPVRNDQEFTYQGVKRAWIGHKLRGEKGGWGRVERNLEKEKEIEEKLAAASAEAAVAAAEVEEAEAADKSAGSTGGGDGKRARKYRDIRCFNCGEVGHSAADCPKEAFSGKGRCWNCGEAGHDAKACPKKKE